MLQSNHEENKAVGFHALEESIIGATVATGRFLGSITLVCFFFSRSRSFWWAELNLKLKRNTGNCI